ncbi:NnrS family protein [Aliikangiella maris]|uniref:NnrS family protein n=2 Tax=Aliikangiella maris TaxID=3162458 RepID=A0ABV3MNR1_9GAMM
MLAISSIQPWRDCFDYRSAVYVEAFRPFFIFIPIYLVLSIVLWALVWSGFWQTAIFENILVWHIYEMLFGIGSAGMAGFILTAIPEFITGTKPVVGKKLYYLFLFWLGCRFAFWMIDWLGVTFVALVNLLFTCVVIYFIAQPIISDFNRRHVSLLLSFLSIVGVQVLFYLSLTDWLDIDFLAISQLSLGMVMILITLVLLRVNMGVVNRWLQQQQIVSAFVVRIPAYSISVFLIALYSIVEYLLPFNSILGWLGFAVGASILNLLNDFVIDDVNLFRSPHVVLLTIIFVLMACGYFFMGYDHLSHQLQAVNHFRHFLTTGVFGLSFFVIMSIVTTLHTGRPLAINSGTILGALCILVATMMRVGIAWWPELSANLYFYSALIWGAAFIIYLLTFFNFLTEPKLTEFKLSESMLTESMLTESKVTHPRRRND